MLKKIYAKFAEIGFIKKLMQISFFEKVLSYEFLVYLVFGVLTTLVNFVVSFICNKIFGLGTIFSIDIFSHTFNFTWAYVTNIIAWIASVLFAYFTNKILVFENFDWSGRNVLREMASFFSARLLSLLLFELGFFAAADNLALNAGLSENASYWIAKILAAVLTVLFNYVASKFVIFKNKKKEKQGVDE